MVEVEASQIGRRFLIYQFGARCAAWLIWTNRARLKRFGRLKFAIPTAKELPPWFEVAFCFLRDFRSAKWEVSKSAYHGTTTYGIAPVARKIPAVLRG